MKLTSLPVLLLVVTCVLPGWSLSAVAVAEERAEIAEDIQQKTTAIYGRAAVQYELVDFFKPIEGAPGELPVKLAPLILIVVETNQPARQGNLTLCPFALTNGTPVAGTGDPTVYFDIDSVLLHQAPHTRLSYLWFLRSKTNAAPLELQGVRLTLDRSGQPAIWEILRDPSGLRLMLASGTIESAASAEYGKPMRGRRYSIEGPLDQAERAVVARVIEDGPVPMGPIIYQRANGLVDTLICRCMPTQAKAIRNTVHYQLLPWSTIAGVAARYQVQQGWDPCFWPGSAETKPRLERVLRLPPNF